MPIDDEGQEEFAADYEDFVPAVYARNSEDAEKYRELLEDHDIPVVVEDSASAKGKRRGMSRGVALLVPEPLLDEASEVIAEYERDEGHAAEEYEEEEEEEELDGFEEDVEDEEEEFDLDEDDDEFEEEEEEEVNYEEGEDEEEDEEL